MCAQNFFIAGPPVRGASFFGREELLHRARRAVSRAQPMLLIGQRRIGKSSILQRIEFLLNRDDPDCAVIRIDAQMCGESRDLSQFEREIERKFRDWASEHTPRISLPKTPDASPSFA